MKTYFQISGLLIILLISSQSLSSQVNRIRSTIDSSIVNEICLKQEFVANVNIDDVWAAFTTVEGWENWAVAKAKIDFRLGGSIKTSYSEEAEIGDSTTITLHVVNYVPKRLLTLQAELSPFFPEFMKEDEKNLYNVIIFEPISDQATRIISYGIGYRNNEKYNSLLQFFIQGNEASYQNLLTYLETGKKSNRY